MLRRLLSAMYKGDREAALPYFTPGSTNFGPAGVANPAIETATSFTWRDTLAGRVAYIRHIAKPTPDTAFGVVIWKNPKAQPPADAGIYDFVLQRQDGKWYAFTFRTAYMQPLPAPPPRRQQAGKPGEWRSLFDGNSTRGWMPPQGPDGQITGWTVDEGTLGTVPKGGRCLITEEEFQNFELEWEWKAASKANSGVSYQLFGLNLGIDAIGLEYQIADDNGDPGAIGDHKQKSGALYGTVPVSRTFSRPLGEWNQSRIRLQNNRAEHWLNGEKAAEYEVDAVFPSPISLQYHGAGVRFRNIRIRTLPEN